MVTPLTAPRRQKAVARAQADLAKAIAALEAKFGAGIVYRLTQARPKVADIALSTGSLGLDYATGIGGLPRGRISELYGPPSCGKTSIAYHLLANAQTSDGMAAFVDLGQIMDAEAMIACGVAIDDLIVAVPFSTIEALEIVEILARCRALDAIVLSVPAMLPDGSRVSRYLFEALRKLNVALRASPTAMIFVNEQGNPLNPLPFYTSIRIGLAPERALLGPSGAIVALRARAVVNRNKLGQPGATVEIAIRANGGLFREAELLDLAIAHTLVEILPLGPAYRDELLGKSYGQALAYLGQNTVLLGQLETELRKKLCLRPVTC